MSDLLVALYRLPRASTLVEQLQQQDVIIRRANPWELSQVREFITDRFSEGWADETTVGFARQPISVFLAVIGGGIAGFASYECTRRGFFGPTGVTPEHRRKGIGTALLLRSLEGLKEIGYAYAIIGSAGPAEWYQRSCGAVVIPDSSPGIYTNMLKNRR